MKLARPLSLATLLLASCSGSSSVKPSADASRPDTSNADGPVPDRGGDAALANPALAIPIQRTITSTDLSAPVDLIRDQWGIPHIYGSSLHDVAFAEGYIMANDRIVEMDFGRAEAEGTLAALGGSEDASLLQVDIQMRMHHLKTTAQTAYTQLQASTDPKDQELVKTMTSFTAGVNQWLADVKSGVATFGPGEELTYDPTKTLPWTEVDSIALSYLQAFELAFDADSEITLSQIDTQASIVFADGKTAALKARADLPTDLDIYAPFDPTYTLPSGWTGFNGDNTHASLKKKDRKARTEFAALLERGRRAMRGVGNDHLVHPMRGSNNFIVGPGLTDTGHVIVANDTHLSLMNPSVFYLVHVDASGGTIPINAMGVNFPGIPGIVLGNNEHLAWGATTNYIDVTDVYEESIVPCSGSAPCVQFNGAPVATVPRVETFQVGLFNQIASTTTVTYYDVPQHGPIIPSFEKDGTEKALGKTEMSIKYTGYQPAQLIRALANLATATTMQDGVAALDADFLYGGQNWVIGDDAGNFGWTEVIQVPLRAAKYAPYKVLPGDGTAEWGANMDPKYIPHAYNPTAGFLATANADPIGVTAKNSPFFGQPTVSGTQLYLGWDYDPGTRVGQLTKQIQAATAGGKKLSLSDVGTIQADVVSEWAQAFAPLFVSTAADLAAEIATPGSHPNLTAIVQAASATSKPLVQPAHDAVAAWTDFETSSGVVLETSPQQVADSLGTLLHAVWLVNLKHLGLDDEIKALGVVPDDFRVKKLLAVMVNDPSALATGISKTTGDAVLWDNLNTKPIESKEQIAASAIFAALDFLTKTLGTDMSTWRWGTLHTLTLDYITGYPLLNLPPMGSTTDPNGYPRHGDDGTVDVGDHGFSLTDFTYNQGPAIRFGADLGPGAIKAQNVLPGGEIDGTHSPHYDDQLQLWLANQAFGLAYYPSDVLASAKQEYAKNKDGRLHFAP